MTGGAFGLGSLVVNWRLAVETRASHLDVLRDLERINAHIAAAAFAVLEKRGELLPSRLRGDEEVPQ
jgi:hypothetical protein